MIQRRALVDAFERELVRREAPNYFQNLKIVEALYNEARALGVLPPADPLDGIEVDVHLASVLNVRASS
ncbi:MAG: hypothetical protein AABZ22_01400 [Nitrospirota bacterium]